MNDTFWYLETVSCVLVRRNKIWFNTIKHKFKELWDTVLKERETGYEHRKPKKKRKKNLTPNTLDKIKKDTKNLFMETNFKVMEIFGKTIHFSRNQEELNFN